MVGVGKGTRVELYDVQTRTRRWLSKTTKDLSDIAFSPNDRVLAVATGYGSIELLDATSGHVTHTIRCDTQDSLRWTKIKFSPDGTFLASKFDFNTIRFWDMPVDEQQSATYSNFPKLPDTTISGCVLASGYGALAQYPVYRVRKWEPLGHKKNTFSPDSKLVALYTSDYSIQIWDTLSLKKIHEIQTVDCYNRTIAFSPDAKLIAALSKNGNLFVFDLDTGVHLDQCKENSHRPTHIYFLNNDRLLVYGFLS
ncbi:hypothetical protein MKX08_005314 [Trichoderma sp. CBMAI-0020]|nr:hypothetical protein MKX08_005314 [Trichoderma sp. CBMAI-0020]WOD45737.1 hypothetical protein [Trichoderma atroviride]